MRKIKAILKCNEKDEPVAAFPTGYVCQGNEMAEDWHHDKEGYILTPLKKATSRNKGNSAERVVAEYFSLWLYGDPKVLTRTPLSGGFNNSKLGDISGDPARLMELKLGIPKFYVEVKNRDGLLSEEFFNWVANGAPKRMSEWIADTIRKSGMMPWFIVLKGRGTDYWIFTNSIPDKNAFVLTLTCESQAVYFMYPITQLAAFNTYNDLKQRIING